jgi:elongation factor G
VKVYESKDVRNVGLVGHGDSGKTSLTAGLLFTTNAANRLLRVDEGNTVTDFDEEEISRKITISTAIGVAEWKKTKINILDTPGYNIFINDTRAALVAADAALVLVDGVAGVEVQTEKVWQFTEDFKLPRAVIINKLDRERADFDRALAGVQENFSRAAVPIQIPIGSEREFSGIVDLIRMKAYTYSPDGDGKGKEGDIPASVADAAQKAHEALIEMVAEGNDALLEEFFDKGTLPVEHIVDGLRQGIREMRIFPVLCASAIHNIGADLILNLIVDNLPSPLERGAVAATINGAEGEQKISAAGPASRHRHVKALSVSGPLNSARTLPKLNGRRNGAERSMNALIEIVRVTVRDGGFSLLDRHLSRLGLLDNHAPQRRERPLVDPVVVLPKLRTLQRLAAMEEGLLHRDQNDQARLAAVDGSRRQ